MTLKEIAVEHIKRHGFDGLYRFGCSCSIDELMDCEDIDSAPHGDCVPGYKTACVGAAKCGNIECGGEIGSDCWSGVKEKP